MQSSISTFFVFRCEVEKYNIKTNIAPNLLQHSKTQLIYYITRVILKHISSHKYDDLRSLGPCNPGTLNVFKWHQAQDNNFKISKNDLLVLVGVSIESEISVYILWIFFLCLASSSTSNDIVHWHQACNNSLKPRKSGLPAGVSIESEMTMYSILQ